MGRKGRTWVVRRWVASMTAPFHTEKAKRLPLLPLSSARVMWRVKEGERVTGCVHRPFGWVGDWGDVEEAEASSKSHGREEGTSSVLFSLSSSCCGMALLCGGCGWGGVGMNARAAATADLPSTPSHSRATGASKAKARMVTTP